MWRRQTEGKKKEKEWRLRERGRFLVYNSQEKCKYRCGGIQIQIGRASRHLLQQFMGRPLPQREAAEPLSQTKLLSSVSETATPLRLFTASSDTDKDPEKHGWTAESKNTPLIEEGKCGFVNYLRASLLLSFSFRFFFSLPIHNGKSGIEM